ncbi:HEAT repeat protein, partial [Oesophagostomum dentatum]
MEEFLPSEKEQKCSSSSEYFASDAFGFGKLIYYVAGKFDENDGAVQSLVELGAKLATADRAARLPLSAALDHPALSNDLTELINFCNTIQLKESVEKSDFYRSIVSRLRSLPSDVVAKRLCRLLLSRYVLLEPKSHSELYPFLLVPADDGEGILPRECYNAYMVPELVRLFRVREPVVRIALLSLFDRFARYIPRERLEGFVRDEIIQGCYDSDSSLVASSLRALATLVDILGAEAVCPWQTAKKLGTGSPQVCVRKKRMNPSR